MLPKRFSFVLYKCNIFIALDLICINFNFGCIKELVLNGFKLLQNWWVRTRLGMTIKQLEKKMVDLGNRYYWLRHGSFQEVPKLFWPSEMYISKILNTGSKCLLRFLLIYIYFWSNSF